MKKLEKLKSKEILKKELGVVVGGIAASSSLASADYTIYSTNCTETGVPDAWDCGDSTKDKDK